MVSLTSYPELLPCRQWWAGLGRMKAKQSSSLGQRDLCPREVVLVPAQGEAERPGRGGEDMAGEGQGAGLLESVGWMCSNVCNLDGM